MSDYRLLVYKASAHNLFRGFEKSTQKNENMQDICFKEVPKYREILPGHYVSCHYPVEDGKL